jgi:hypothetical protein
MSDDVLSIDCSQTVLEILYCNDFDLSILKTEFNDSGNSSNWFESGVELEYILNSKVPSMFYGLNNNNTYKLKDTIRKIFWRQLGENDGVPWYLIAESELDDKSMIYFFAEAVCDYTGIECCGTHFRIYFSDTLEDLVKYGITDSIRNLIVGYH